MAGKAYFIVGDRYARYDMSSDEIDDGYPKLIAGNWGGFGSAGFGSGIQAALTWNVGKFYCFKGGMYVRASVDGRIDSGYPMSIGDGWRGLESAGFGADLDAAIDVGEGDAWFFKGDRCLRYTSISGVESITAGPGPISVLLPGLVGTGMEFGIDAAVRWNSYTGYLFRGANYLRISIPDTLPQQSVLPIATRWGARLGVTFGEGGVDAIWTNLAGAPGSSSSVAEFVRSYLPGAQTSERNTGVPALVALGQLSVESGWGVSAPGHNLFGITAHVSIPESQRQLLKTREVFASPNMAPTPDMPEIISVTPRTDGKYDYVVRRWFRKFPDDSASFDFYGQMLQNARYAAAFQHTDDPYAFAREIAKAGYATAPNYYDVLAGRMRLIEPYL